MGYFVDFVLDKYRYKLKIIQFLITSKAQNSAT